MIATLERLLVGEAGLLEQVNHHVGAGQLAGGVEVDPDKLAEPGGVVVPHSLGVAPGLQDGVGLDDLVLKGGFALLPLARGADGGEVGDDLLRVLSLPGSRLASDEDRLRKDEVSNRSLSWWSWSSKKSKKLCDLFIRCFKLHCSSHQASKNTQPTCPYMRFCTKRKYPPKKEVTNKSNNSNEVLMPASSYLPG